MQRPVAIIGAAHRLPGTTNQNFWQRLREGANLISQVASDRWDSAIFSHPNAKQPGTAYTHAAGSLGDIAGFDHAFFGISPREAAQMDPQQRIMLELAWETLENAGIPPSHLRGSDCGVYTGVASLDYSYRIAEDTSAIESATATGNASSVIANRISHALDLRGPSMALDTACSSALLAFHQGCQAIRSGEITTALTGAVSMHLHPLGFILFSKAKMLSATGRSHVFDDRANGYVRSEGAGLFLIKDQEKAIADGDRILATVAASAANADGYTSGLTIPQADAQMALMDKAMRMAGLTADDIHYLEAHGTGTAIGDPIETRAIGAALGRGRQKPLPLGSVKSNLGHLETAAGVASIAKALGVIENRAIPATIGIEQLNPAIDFEALNLDPVTEYRHLPGADPVHVGINSFGFGGANTHVILASPPRFQSKAPTSGIQSGWPIRISARSDNALQAQAAALGAYLETQRPPVEDVAATLFCRRDQLDTTLALFATNTAEATVALREFGRTGETPEAAGQRRPIAQARGPLFLYTGNGCQWHGMGHALIESSPIVSDAIDEIQALYDNHADIDLKAELAAAEDSLGMESTTARAQPALFALQVGITRLLDAHGIAPAAVVGHSVGEVAAAWAAGALALPEAVKVVHHRSQQQERTRGLGGMTAAAMGAADAQSLIRDLGAHDVCVAADNAPTGVTLAGSETSLSRVELHLREQGVTAKRLPLAYPFHSAAMDLIEAPVQQVLADLNPKPTTIPLISTVTGAPIAGEQLGAGYWWRNIREPVQFRAAVAHQVDAGTNVFVEIGAYPLLERYTSEILGDQDGRIIPTLTRERADAAAIQSAAASVIATGCRTRNDDAFPTPAPLVPLPPYPWQREHHWVQHTSDSLSRLNTAVEHPLLGYPVPGAAHTWQSQLDISRLPWLADHQIDDTVVFPATGFAEIAAAAAANRQSAIIGIEDLEIHEALVLDAAAGKQLRIRLEPQRGRLTIEGREPASHDPWQRQVSARLTPEPAGLRLRRQAPELPQREPDFNRDSHQASARALGLHYGPAFQASDAIWVEGSQVIARLDRTEAIADAGTGTLTEPAVTDSAFQLFIALLGAESSDCPAYLPVRLGRLQHDTEAGQPILARMCLRSRGPHSLCADFELFDADGCPVTVIESARFQAMPLSARTNTPVGYLIEELTPQPLDRALETGTRTIPDAEMVREFQESVAQGYVEEIEPLLDRLVEAFAAEAFDTLADDGWLGNHRIAAWRTENATVDARWERVLALLVDAGRIEQGPADWRLIPEDEPVAARTIWQLLIREHPEAASLIHRVGRTGQHLVSLLTNGADADALQFDSSEIAGLTRHNANARAWRRAANAVADSIRTRQSHLGCGERLALLVAGSQAPLLTEAVTAHLDITDTDLIILSHDDETRREAERVTHEHPGVEMLEQEHMAKADARMNTAAVSVDAASRQRTLAMLRALTQQLVPDATVTLVGVQPSHWMELIIDDEQTIDADALRTALLGLGFTDIRDIGDTPAHGGYVMTARSPEAIAADSPPAADWCIAHDSGSSSIATDLANRLQAKGQRVERAIDPHQEASADRLIDLCGLGSLDSDATQRCQNLLRRFQAREAGKTATDLWLITSGVAGMFNSLDPVNGEPAEDAALWGLTRALQNEARQTTCRLIDIPLGDDGAASAFTLDALTNSLVAADAETEVVITAQGARLAPRLREQPQPSSDAEDSPDQAVSLAFAAPGRLTNLAWQPREKTVPGAQQVSVAVEATGLNFRDVMYALGLLSDEAIESGFTGPTLGLEFAGTITDVGEEITDFAPGDDVVGFGPASFSNHLTVDARTLAHRPANITAEAAATIPTTFFTAYYALQHLARVQPGERVLIHGAAGGVGLAAIQIAQWLGAEVYATVGSASKRDFLRLSGIERLYDSRRLTFAEAIEADTAGDAGVDVVVNVLAGQAIEENLRLLKPFGRFIELGKRDFYEDTAVGLRPFRNNLSYFGLDSDQLLRQRPAYARRVFSEVMALFNEGTFTPLPYVTFTNDRVIDAFRYMQQARQIGKVVVSNEQRVLPQPRRTEHALAPPTLTRQRTWIITGGLTGFGRRTAEWLADHGATHLLLLSRRGAEHEEGIACLQALNARGVTAQAPVCDITDRAALADVLANCRESMPPIGGIVHAAAVIDDALAQNMEPHQLQRVLETKIEGARHLDELTRESPIEHFILYSSATTLFGNPGQSSYVAANTWLESLAAARRARGVPGLCLRWGAISDVGFLARHSETREALQQRLGGSSLTADEALEHLGRLLSAPRTNIGVLRLEWRSLARSLPQANAPRLSEMARQYAEDPATAEAEQDWQRLLAHGSPEEQREALIEVVRQQLAGILLLDTAQLDMQQSLDQLGMDSLMGVELVTALENDLGVSVPTMALTEAVTPMGLVDRILERLAREEDEVAPDTPAQADDTELAALAKRHGVDELQAVSERKAEH